MDSPIEKFIEWYMSLPVSHRQSIAEFVVLFDIGFDGIATRNIEELPNAFVRKLSRYSHDKLKGTGLALMLRANVNFLIRKRGNREGWKESEEFLLGAKEYFTATGKGFMVDSANKFLKELPFKREQWISTSEKWEKLVESYLSDEYLDRWWKDMS